MSDLVFRFVESSRCPFHQTRAPYKRYLILQLAHSQIALRREKPGGRTITSSSQEVSKMGSDDEDEITLAEADAVDTVFPTPKKYGPAPDVSVLS